MTPTMTPTMTRKSPLRLLLAAPRGFCAGVSRAVSIVEEALTLYGAPIYVRHQIVHNRHVVEDLAERGAIFVEDLRSVPRGARIIFSAHGVAKAVRAEAEARGLTILDATCPLVSKVHREALRHHQAGRHLLLIGHRGHVEVRGTLGQIPEEAATVLETAEEAEALKTPPGARLAYATQTTLSVSETAGIIEILRRRFPDIAGPRGEDICYATTNRQSAVRRIAPMSDYFLVVGSKNSSNSARLVETALMAGAPQAALIENAAAIDWRALPSRGTVGLTAGASAPERLAQEVIDGFRARYQLRLEEIGGEPERMRFPMPRELRQPPQAETAR